MTRCDLLEGELSDVERAKCALIEQGMQRGLMPDYGLTDRWLNDAHQCLPAKQSTRIEKGGPKIRLARRLFDRLAMRVTRVAARELKPAFTSDRQRKKHRRGEVLL